MEGTKESKPLLRSYFQIDTWCDLDTCDPGEFMSLVRESAQLGTATETPSPAEKGPQGKEYKKIDRPTLSMGW